MRLTELWKKKDKPTLSFELFPARSEKAAANLDKAIVKLAALQPDFVSVTFGAGGSTREGSRQLIEKLLGMDLDVVAYFACYGLGPDDLSAVLDDYRSMGVETILAVRGDPPHDNPDFQPHPESLKYASDLVKFVEGKWDFCLGAAAYPEGHIDAPSKEKDWEYVKLKVDNGARFIITNYVYDTVMFTDFMAKMRQMGIEVPVMPGVMPIFSVKMMENLAKLCGATITDEIKQGLAKLPADDKKAVGRFGIDLATRQCAQLIEAGAPGVHIYTMDRSKASVEVVNRLRADGLI